MEKLLKENIFIYIFKRRKMKINVPLDSDQYLIVPNGFEPYTEVNSRCNKTICKEKIILSCFLGRSKKSIVRKCTKNNGR